MIISKNIEGWKIQIFCSKKTERVKIERKKITKQPEWNKRILLWDKT